MVNTVANLEGGTFESLRQNEKQYGECPSYDRKLEASALVAIILVRRGQETEKRPHDLMVLSPTSLSRA